MPFRFVSIPNLLPGDRLDIIATTVDTFDNGEPANRFYLKVTRDNGEPVYIVTTLPVSFAYVQVDSRVVDTAFDNSNHAAGSGQPPRS